MADNINKWIGTGTLTRDAEQSFTQSGYSILKFALASNYSKKVGDSWQKEASFFDFILWGKRGEALAQYMTKGAQVAIEGKLKQDRWEKDGQKRSKIVIEVDNIQLIGGRSESKPVENKQQDPPSNFEDDIPF